MLVACSRCHTKYNIPADKLDGAILKVRCKKCGHVFGVRKKVKVAEPSPEEQPTPRDGEPEQERDWPGEPREKAPAPESPEDYPSDQEPEAQPSPDDDLQAALDLFSKAQEQAAAEPEPMGEAAPTPEPQTEPLMEDDLQAALDLDSFSQPEEEAAPAPQPQTEPSPEDDLQAAFDLDSFSRPEEEAAPAPEPETEPLLDDDLQAALDLDSFSFSDEKEPGETAPPDLPTEGGDSISFDDFDLGDLDAGATEEEAKPDFSEQRKEGAEETDLGNLDLSDFDTTDFDLDLPGEELEAATTEEAAPPSKGRAAKKSALPDDYEPSAEDFAKGLQELDLGAFEEKEEAEPLRKVHTEDLLPSSAAAYETAKGKSGKVKGPGIKLPWGLITMVLILGGSVSFLAYNVVVGHDAAFAFLNPSAVSKILQLSDMQKKLALIAPQEGGYIERIDKTRLYVAAGYLKNNTASPVGAVKVRAFLYDGRGTPLTSREAFCGNVLDKDELSGLPLPKIMETVNRQVGEGFSNVDVAPGAKVPYMVVFQEPPSDVAKYSVEVLSFTGGKEANTK